MPRKPSAMQPSFSSAFKAIYSVNYIVLNVVIMGVYLLLFQYLISVQNFGVFLSFVPPYLIYMMAITSSMLFTIAVRSFYAIKLPAQPSAGILGTATMLLGGIFGGCGCTAPILLSFTAIGASASSIISLSNVIVANQFAIFTAMIAINIFAIIYYVNRISRAICKTR